MSKLLTKITNLVEVKKIIALLVISVFCYLAIVGRVASDVYTQIAVIIVSFYFGQSTAKGTVKQGGKEE